MPQSGPPVTRGHLRLATPVDAPRAENRALLVLRAAATAVTMVWSTVAAWVAAAFALAPLVWRRAPLGRRARPMPPREARIIPFQPRRQALPR